MPTKGHIISDETKKKIGLANSVALLGNVPWNKGLEWPDMAGKNNPNWKGKIKKTCLTCKKTFETYPVHRNRAKFCSKKCLWASMVGKPCSPEAIKQHMLKARGENHWNFKGWKSREPYGQRWTRALKESIRQRDNYKCQKCGVPQEECITKLSVHHKDSVKTNLSPENLVSLCKRCHGKTHLNKNSFEKLKEIT